MNDYFSEHRLWNAFGKAFGSVSKRNERNMRQRHLRPMVALRSFGGRSPSLPGSRISCPVWYSVCAVHDRCLALSAAGAAALLIGITTWLCCSGAVALRGQASTMDSYRNDFRCAEGDSPIFAPREWGQSPSSFLTSPMPPGQAAIHSLESEQKPAGLLPIKTDDIQMISILDADDKLLARVKPQYYRAICACLNASKPPESPEGFPCILDREAEVHLKDGRVYRLQYHGGCNAPEYYVVKKGEHTGPSLWSLRLKELFRLLETSKIRIRFVRLRRQGNERFAVVGSCAKEATLKIPTSQPDGKGYSYSLVLDVASDGSIVLAVKVAEEKLKATPIVDKTVRLRDGEFLPNGHSRVLASTRDAILLMTVEPFRR